MASVPFSFRNFDSNLAASFVGATACSSKLAAVLLAQMIDYCGMHFTFEGNAGKFAVDPSDDTKRRIDPANLHDYPIADRGEACPCLDLASAFGKVEQIDKDDAGLHPALDHQAKRATVIRTWDRLHIHRTNGLAKNRKRKLTNQ